MPVNGFEKQTHELSDVERRVIAPYIAGRLEKNVGKKNAVTSKAIIYECNGIKLGQKINGPRLRAIIHYIRTEGLVVNLIATSKGYYVATSLREVSEYIESLKQRRNSIDQVRAAMQRQLDRQGTII